MTTASDSNAEVGNSGPYASHAMAYWRAGWANPIPVKEKKWPPRGYTGREGRNVSGPDLHAWTEGPEAAHNIGLRMAGTVGIDVDSYGDKRGAESLAKAVADLGELPATWSSTSRGPGQPSRIHFFHVPGTGTDLADAEQRFRKAYGEDVEIIHRGHRYAVVAPSIHPGTGQPYRWYGPDGEPSGRVPERTELPELPAAWLAFLTEPEPAPVSTPGTVADPFPPASMLIGGAGTKSRAGGLATFAEQVDRFRSLTTEGNGRSNLLAGVAVIAGRCVAAGFMTEPEAHRTLLDAAQANGYQRTHRDADTQIRNGIRDGKADPWTVVPDHLESTGQGEQAAPGWTADDLTDVLSGKRVRVVPELAQRQDGVALLYRGKEHAVAGEPESGKTWFALMCARDVLLSGGRVLYVDFEDDAATVVGRLLDLGVLADRLRPASGQFRYVRPEGAPRAGDVLALLTFPDGPAELLVYDGWTEGAALMGQDIMSQDDIAKWRQALVKPALTLGTATLTTDHVVKNRDARGRYSIGAQHKLAGLTGVMFTMEVTKTWGRGSKGVSKVLITKDRNGGLRPYGKADEANLTHIGDLVGDATSGEMVSLILWPPFVDEDEADDTNPIPSHLRKPVAAVVAALDGRPEPLSLAEIERRAHVRKGDVGKALAWLEDSGRVLVERGLRNAKLHRLAPEVDGQSGQGESAEQ
ncbi:bifunctional DNA primase/polymerase [Micromonospora inositola]|uniref:RecA-superfamily ATPase, KaiC/GvpD/RAD55 family n=1 Tax=Micromonospora inositola TaxID=47865 RepID=A0A1C5IR81_9ACTN|nr:bifunctional DNA primase/polymerase [Micromonospora inositola]SCG60296.1 RecA-superfamily ATPase, KaiC/GvpD/RAD55 family [Micromonospora inositola]